ncbi:MAG TPA: glycosyltransferase family 4 protein [Flavisolibacter sp.]|nr:glycosyltransferase family 4 protein [Flavisolibacter sp.]
MQRENTLIRMTTVPISLKVLLRQQLKFMAAYYNVLAVSSPEKELEQVAAAEGVRTKSVRMTRSITPLEDLKALWSLYKLFKKEKPLIVHTHTPKAGLLGMLASRLAGVPIRIHTVAGLPLMETKGGKRKLLELVEKLTYMCAHRVYPNSKNLARFIIQSRFCKESKLKVLGNGSSNGINTAFFAPTPDIMNEASVLKQRLGLHENDFVFVFIGRLVKDKGIQELVQAFTTLKERYPQIKLLLVGPYEQALDPLSQETLNQIEQDPAIVQVGFQQDVRPYLAISQALVFPSYREGFPNVPMQAGCMELPSIVTDINGCNEIIEEGKNGLIVPVKDDKSLEAAMERLLEDKVLYTRLKENARPMIVERFDQNRLWKAILQEYQELQTEYENVSKLSQAIA